MNNGILLASMIENISTRRDGTIKVTLGTQELSNGKAGDLFALNGKLAAVYICAKSTIPQADLDQVDQVDVDMPGKTQSQRMRSVLYLLWEQNKEGFKEFQGYYRAKPRQSLTNLKTISCHEAQGERKKQN